MIVEFREVVNSKKIKMPGAVNTPDRRKVRCPKCISPLTEPPPGTPIYQCPICLVFLIAKGDAGRTSGGVTENGRDAGNTQQTMENRLDLEKAGVIEEQARRQGHQEMELAEERHGSSEGLSLTDSSGEKTDRLFYEYPRDRSSSLATDDQPLYRKRNHRSRTARAQAFMPKVDPSTSEMPLYNPPRRRRPSHSSDRSGESSDRSERGTYHSGLDSASGDGSEADFNFPALSSQNGSAAELPNPQNVDDGCQRGHTNENHVDTSLLKRNISKEPALSKPDQMEELQLDSETADNSEANQQQETFGDECLADVEETRCPHQGDPIVSGYHSQDTKLEDESGDKSFTEAFEETRQPLQHNDVKDSSSDGSDGMQQGSLKQVGLLTTFTFQGKDSDFEANLRYSDVWTERLLVNSEVPSSLDISLCDWQHLRPGKTHDEPEERDVGKEFVDQEETSNLDEAAPPGSFPKDGENSVAWTERSLINSEVPSSLDTSLNDQQHSQLHGIPEERDVGKDFVDEKEAANLAKAAPPDSSPKDGDCTTYSSLQKQDVAVEIQNQPREQEASDFRIAQHGAHPVMREPGISDPHNAPKTAENGGHLEKTSIPLRTAAMHKFLGRTGLEYNTAQLQLLQGDTESKADNYEAPYLGDYQSSILSSIMDKVEQSVMGRLDSNEAPYVGDYYTSDRSSIMDSLDSNELKINRSNIHPMDISRTQGLAKKPFPSPESELMSTARHHQVMEDVYLINRGPYLAQSQGGDTAGLQRTSLAQQHCTADNNSQFPVQMPKSYHHFDDRNASTQRLQRSEYREELTDLFNHRMPSNGENKDPHMAALTRNVKELSVSHGRFLDSQSSDQPAFPHADWQKQNANLQSWKLRSDRDVADQDPVRVYHGTTEKYCVHPTKRLQQSIPQVHEPNQHYTASSLGSSLPPPSGHAFPFQVPSQAFMMPASTHEHPFACCAQHSASPPVCTLCAQQSHLQHYQLLHETMQHHRGACYPQPASMAQQQGLGDHWPSAVAHHLQPSSHQLPQIGLYQRGNSVQQAQEQHRSVAQLKSQVQPLMKQKRYPPLPRDGAAPYVLCQRCNQLLHVPADLPPNNGSLQKLRCGACFKISKFSVQQLAVTANHTSVKSSWSSSLGFAKSLIETDINTTHLVKSSTAGKPRPDTRTVLPLGHRSPFLPDNHGRLHPHSIATQGMMEPACQQMPDGLHANFGYPSPSHHVQFESRMLFQANANASSDSAAGTLDHVYHSRPSTGGIQSQGFSRSQLRIGEPDTFLNSHGTYGEPYLSSSPSSTAGSSPVANTPDKFVNEHRVFGGRRMVEGLLSDSNLNAHGGSGSQTLYFSGDDHLFDFGEDRIGFPSASPASIRKHFSYGSPKEVVGRHQPTWLAKSPHRQLKESDYSRSSSKNSNGPLTKHSAAPGSPLFEHFTYESADFGPDLQQRAPPQDSGNKAPWSPAPGSPLYEHFTYDSSADFDESLYPKEQDASRSNGGSAQDAGRGPKYLAGLLKKSFREFSKGSQGNSNFRRRVMINGQSIPDASVRKAEEQAGTIHPGSYWYDYQAGFWGVMGGPCLGIIPPFIEELNFPMAKDCSGGRTGVLVNGREVHKKDLEVLARRGLPTIPGKAYIVEITGRVVDEASGQQLRTLGKLAPTVEKKGRGYGMFQPSTLQSGSGFNLV